MGAFAQPGQQGGELLLTGQTEPEVADTVPGMLFQAAARIKGIREMSAVNLQMLAIRFKLGEGHFARVKDDNVLDKVRIEGKRLLGTLACPYDLEYGTAEGAAGRIDHLYVINDLLLGPT